ncbi:MAG: hypothetical protein ACK5AZ_23405, partial [Bryobacteraceae bacterium]
MQPKDKAHLAKCESFGNIIPLLLGDRLHELWNKHGHYITFREGRQCLFSLLSGYKSHRFNWLENELDFSWDSS